jgi:SSS family solute:Na+ symporter
MWAIVVAYVAFIFFQGVSKARKVSNTDDFLVAGRKVGWFFLFCTMGATVIGGGSSVGAIAKTYEWGVLMLLVSTGWYLHFIFSGLFVAPRFREARLYTVAGYFGHRFGEGPRFAVLVLSLLFSVFIVAAQMAAFGSVLSAILPEFADRADVLLWSIAIGGALVIIYSTAGGLLAVIHTDVYQFVILILGLLATTIFCLPDLLSNSAQRFAAIPQTFFQLEGGKGWLFAVTTFAAFLLGETFAPGYATRYCVGRDIRQTKLGIAGVGLFLALVFPAVLFFIATYARLHFPNVEPQQALPLVIVQLNNPIVGGLIIAALLMAVMSSADSALNSATAIFVKDLFEHQLGWREDGSGRSLRLARICTVGLGGVSVGIAILWPDIIGLLLLTYHLWAPAIILPVCVGVFSKERSRRLTGEVLITMLVAIAITLIYRFGLGADTVDPAVVGVGASCVVFGLLRLTRLARPGVAN